MELIYWVCTAGDDNRATGHVSVCISCHAPGKPSQKGHRITWIGPFAEKHLALEAASATGRTFDWCYRCRNFTGELPLYIDAARDLSDPREIQALGDLATEMKDPRARRDCQGRSRRRVSEAEGTTSRENRLIGVD